MAVNGLAGFHGSAVHPTRVLRNLPSVLLGQPAVSHANSATATTRGGCYGVVAGGDLNVTATGALNISIAAGRLAGPGTTALAQGGYVGYNDAAVATAVGARNATNPRIDYIAWRVRDTDEDATGAEDDGLIVIAGTAAASPVVPTLSAGQGTLVILAEILVPSTANGGPIAITDRRTYLSAIGGVQRCRSTTRPTGAALWQGLLIFELDTNRIWKYSGSAWIAMTGRFGISFQSTAQAIGAGATSTITSSVEFEDTDAYGTPGSGNLTIPAALPGKYMITAYTDSGVLVASNGGGIEILVNATRVARQPMPVTTSQAMVGRLYGLAAGDVVSVVVTNGHTSTANFTTAVEMYRMTE